MRSRALAATFVLGIMGWAGAASAQATGSGASGSADVLMRPGDVLRITVWPNSELGGEFVVEDSGLVYLPLLEAVRAGGVPIADLREDLRRRYGQAMQNPVVTVTPVYPVTITGEVQRPGIHMITSTSGVFEVIGMAGGFRERADSENLRVVRPGEVIEFDALRALETGQGMDAIQLRSGDHIVVPIRRASWLSFGNALTALQTVSLIVWSVQRMMR